MEHHPTTRRAEWVSQGDGPAVNIDSFGIEVWPQPKARQRLRGERLVEFDKINVCPRFPGPCKRAIRCFDRGDPEDVRVVAGGAAADDPGEGLGGEGGL